MTRPATLPELLAQGKVKPGDWVECVEPYSFGKTAGKAYQVTENGCFRNDMGELAVGTMTTFRPVKPAKAKKWSDWALVPTVMTVGELLAADTGIQVKRTKDGSLMIRYRKKSHDDAK